jgi:hypothetical protein
VKEPLISNFQGGCICGAVRYECSSDPIMTFNCHCRDCQHVSGGPYIAVLYFPRESFAVTKGELHYHFTTSAAMGEHKRGFCAECGSRITGGESERGIGVAASSLDDPSLFRPQCDIHVADAQPWDHLDPAIPKFDGYPPM